MSSAGQRGSAALRVVLFGLPLLLVLAAVVAWLLPAHFEAESSVPWEASRSRFHERIVEARREGTLWVLERAVVPTFDDPEKGLWYDCRIEDRPAKGALRFAEEDGETHVVWTVRGELGWNPLARFRGAALRARVEERLEGGLARLVHMDQVAQGFGPLQNDPADPRLQAAAKFLQEGRMQEARTVLGRVLEDHPRHGQAELLLGLTYHKEKRYGLALPFFERVVERGPTFPKQEGAWYYLGWCRYWLGDLEGAGEAFAAHLERDPSEGDSHFGLGVIRLERGDLDGAEESLRQGIELLGKRVAEGRQDLASEVAKCHARLADVHMLRDRWDDARAELERCLALWPPHYTAWYKLYRVQTRLGNEELADVAWKRHEYWKARAQETGVGADF